MKPPSLFLILVQLVAPAISARICAYSTRGCIGTFACCNNIDKYACCVFPKNLGWGTLFSDVPPGVDSWYGRTYADQGCINSLNGGSISSSSATCFSVFDSPTYLNPRSARFQSTFSARRAFPEVEIDQGSGLNVTPNVVGFKTSDGKDHLLEVPETQFEELWEALTKGDVERALEKYATVSI